MKRLVSRTYLRSAVGSQSRCIRGAQLYAEHRPGARDKLFAEANHVGGRFNRLGSSRSAEYALGGRHFAGIKAVGLGNLAVPRSGA